MPGTSCQSLFWVARHAYKNSVFGLNLSIWKIWREKGKKGQKIESIEGEKQFSKFYNVFFCKIWKIEDTSFKFEY